MRDDALARAILPKDDAESVISADFVKCELPTLEKVQGKLNDAMSALHVGAPAPDGTGACMWP